MSTLAISAANLSTLENNLQVLANNIGTVSQSVNTVSGHINQVEGQVNTVKNDVKSLEEEIKAFMLEIKQGTVVANARQTILMDQSELDKKFSHRDEVRRRVNGLLQSIDINAIRKSTVENISEETIINAPNYWLAPALVALCAWYTNNKELANNALKEAMARDDEKTSLLFCLVHLRANRIETSMKWLNRYLSMQDPSKMESKIITILDAITSGVFGIEAKRNCLEKVNEWIKELNYPEYKNVQIKRWERYFREKIEKIDDDEFPYLNKYVNENEKVKDIISISRTSENILSDVKNLMEENEYKNLSSTNKIDNLLQLLVFNYDNEELELKKDIQKNKHIIEANGDISKALKEFEKTSGAFEKVNDFYNHITNVAMEPKITNASLTTKKFAISISKDFIIKGYNEIFSIDSANMLPDLTININKWNGTTKNGSNQKELEESLDKFFDDEFHDEIYGERLFNMRMLIATILGIIGIIFTLKIPVASSIIFSVVLIYNIVEFIKANSKREAKIRQLNEIKKQNKNILDNVLAEIVDYYFTYKNSRKDHEQFLDYINSFNYENYIESSNARNIIINGGNN